MRTQVAVIGAGPAGLTLAQLLHLHGIESVILENRSRQYVEARISAGVLEQGVVDLLADAGVGERLAREGLVHEGIELQFAGERHRVAMSALTGGRTITVYGQTEVVKDLIEARLGTGRPLLFGWLGILVAVAPSNDELVYAHDERGFALLSLRSPELSRLYVQCRPDEDIAEWPDERICEELQIRLALPGWTLAEGPVLEKGITPMRSFVTALRDDLDSGRHEPRGELRGLLMPIG